MKKVGVIIAILVGVIGFVLGVTGIGEKFIKGDNSKIENGYFVNNAHKLKFLVPNEWYYKELKDNKSFKVLFAKNTPIENEDDLARMKRSFPNILVDFREYKGSSLEKITNDYLQANKDKVKIESKIDRKIADTPAKELIATADMSMKYGNLGAMKTKQIFIYKNGILYNLIFMDFSDKFEEDVREYDKLISSLILY